MNDWVTTDFTKSLEGSVEREQRCLSLTAAFADCAEHLFFMKVVDPEIDRSLFVFSEPFTISVKDRPGDEELT